MASNNVKSINITCDDPISLVCKLCDKTYQHKDGPLMLPCLHSFCKPCLTQYIEKEESADDKMSCPTCNDRFPSKDINHFPVNLRLSHLAKTTMYEKQAEGGKMKCQKCRGTPKDATTFCCNYCKFLCEQCQDDYLRIRDDEDLEFIELASFKKSEFKIHTAPPKCSEHPKQDLVFFCEVCDELICMHCAQTEHQNHGRSSVHKTAEKEKHELQQLTDGVDDALSIMDRALQQIQDTRDKVKVSAKEATNRINNMCDDLIQAVEDRREALKSKCEEIAEGKDDVLLNQMVEIERMRKKLGYAQLHVRDAINHHLPVEVLCVKKVIEKCLKRSMTKYSQQIVIDRLEDETINTFWETGEIVDGIKKIGHFPSISCESFCYVEGLAVPVAGIGKERTVRVVLKDEKENPVGKCHFQYRLSKVGEDPDEYIPPKVTITQDNDGTAMLGFTPDQPGEYELTIMVRNKPIAIPYKITATESRDYSNFGSSQVTYKGIGGSCFGVAVHDDGTAYATNCSNNTIKVFRPDGTEGQIDGSDNAEGNLSDPRGITIIGDTIYVVNQGKHMVKMYSTDGRYTGCFGGNGSDDGKFKNPLGICTDGNGRVLVADQSNNRIQVFSSDGGFIKSIPCSSAPYDVAVDPVGNIHVALYSSNDIAVYSSLTSAEIDSQRYNLNGNLRYPVGIFIDGEGNRFICGNSTTYITDSSGTQLATRSISGCCCTITDKNGQIYIVRGTSDNNLLII